mmetsp:Transcript_108496/g.317417  ORF Transcript_108496/g.317417 Transcript_108496/m.317417 type:complete len:207 (-) Transcript_108496:29-649(-)
MSGMMEGAIWEPTRTTLKWALVATLIRRASNAPLATGGAALSTARRRTPLTSPSSRRSTPWRCSSPRPRPPAPTRWSSRASAPGTSSARAAAAPGATPPPSRSSGRGLARARPRCRGATSTSFCTTYEAWTSPYDASLEFRHTLPLRQKLRISSGCLPGDLVSTFRLRTHSRFRGKTASFWTSRCIYRLSAGRVFEALRMRMWARS